MTTSLTFTDNDLPSNPDPTKALKITLECNGRITPGILVDTGSAFNLCSKELYEGMKGETLLPTDQTITSFDNTPRKALGLVDLFLEHHGLVSVQNFLVVDVPETFTLILGRPWLHGLGAIASSLHQK